jgi:hypothetical protein
MSVYGYAAANDGFSLDFLNNKYGQEKKHLLAQQCALDLEMMDAYSNKFNSEDHVKIWKSNIKGLISKLNPNLLSPTIPEEGM